MIKFKIKENLLLLSYTPYGGTDWIYKKFAEDSNCTFRNTYSFNEKDIYKGHIDDNEDEDDDTIIFVIAMLEGDYYKFNRNALSINNNLFIHKSAKFRDKMFTAYSSISVFMNIDSLLKEDIYIGNEYGQLAIAEFERLLVEFPNSTELAKYAREKIGNILREYFEQSVDASREFEKYLRRKLKRPYKSQIMSHYSEYEKIKYIELHEKLSKMLVNEIGYNEELWQNEILDIILMMYPKYLYVYKEVQVYDVYSKKHKRLDLMLVDSNGNIDIIEIKKPGKSAIVSSTLYRDNYVPLKELSGTIMQAEKYIYYLNKWGKTGEETLTAKYSDSLPPGMKIRIINPGAILIMGKESILSDEQLEDLEVIRRKYRNIIDIITYEELLRRLQNLITKFSTK